MSASGFAADAAEVQRIVLRRVPFRHTQHLVVRIGQASPARRWLRRVLREFPVEPAAGRARPASHGSRDLQVDVGFSYRGLQALEVSARVLGAFVARAPAFSQGAALRAAAQLGDIGASAPRHWDAAFAQDSAHLVLTLHCDHADTLSTVVDDLKGLAGAARDDDCLSIQPLAPASRLEPPAGLAPAGPDLGEWVHFGYRDGLSRVPIRGWHRSNSTDTVTHEPGEFVLGHVNDEGYNPWSLPLAAEPVRRFVRNGSFAALRQIEQDERAFRAALERWAGDIEPLLAGGGPGGLAATADERRLQAIDLLKAKLCGRWPSGAGFDAGHWTTPGTRDPRDDFDHRHDPQGFGCPFGSHVRRMNPRGGEIAHSARQRVLIRRGQPYGPWYQAGDEFERGLMGLFFCASLEDQFEHLVGHWADRVPLGSDDPGDAKDPLIGAHDDPTRSFAIPWAAHADRPIHLRGLQRFVRTRGTVYLFYPSCPTLEALADGASWADDLDRDEPVARPRAPV